MTDRQLQDFTKEELIEYCLRLIAEIDAKDDYIYAIKLESSAYEEFKDAQAETEICANRVSKAEDHTRDYDIRLYEEREQKKKKVSELNVMDLNNDSETDKKPEPKYGPCDIVWINGLMGRYKIIDINYEYTSKTGGFTYDVTPVDNNKDAYTVHVEESRILELDNREGMYK